MKIQLHCFEVEEAIADYINKRLATEMDSSSEDFYMSITVGSDRIIQKRKLKTKNDYKVLEGDFKLHTNLETTFDVFIDNTKEDD